MRLLHHADSLTFRVPSVLFGVLLIPMTASLGRSLGGTRTAVAAAVFTALSPSAVYFSQEARPYALLQLLSALTYLAFVRGYVDGDGRFRWLFFSSLVLGFLNHPLTAHVAGGLALYMAVDIARNGFRDREKNLYFGMTMASFAALLWLRFRWQPGQYLNGWYSLGPVSFVRTVLRCLGPSMHRVTREPLDIFDALSALTFGAACLGWARLWRTKTPVAVGFGTVFLFSLAILYGSLGGRSMWFWGRYLSPLLPITLVLLAHGVAGVPALVRRSLIVTIAAGVVMIPGLENWARTEVYDRSALYRGEVALIEKNSNALTGAILPFSPNSYLLWDFAHVGLFRTSRFPWYGTGLFGELYEAQPLQWKRGLPLLPGLGPRLTAPLPPGRYGLVRSTHNPEVQFSCQTLARTANVVSCQDAPPIIEGKITIPTVVVNGDGIGGPGRTGNGPGA